MDVYTESAFGILLGAIALLLVDITRRLFKIQRELREWRKEWKATQRQVDTGHNEEQANTSS